MNPRYLEYVRVNGCGRTPEEMLARDKQLWKGGCMCGFILWIQEEHRNFLAPYGGHVLRLPLGSDSQKLFDEHLKTLPPKGV